MKRKPDVALLPARELINLWCKNHPYKAVDGYSDMVNFLMLDYKDQILDFADSFPSGSDVIDSITSTMDMNGLWALLEAIRLRDYGMSNVEKSLDDDIAKYRNTTTPRSWKTQANELLRELIVMPSRPKRIRNQRVRSASGMEIIQVVQPTKEHPVSVMFCSFGRTQFVNLDKSANELWDQLAKSVIREAIYYGNCKFT